MEAWLKEVTDPNDADVQRFSDLLYTTFADDNIRLGADRIRQFLSEAPGGARSCHLVVVKVGEQVGGGTLFSSSAATGAGFSEYIILGPELRGLGLSRRLFDQRREVLDRAARRWGFPAAPGLFVEMESPDRTPPEYAERERTTAVDPRERRRYFHHLGYYRLDFTYRQPALGTGKAPVDYLDLLFYPWAPELVEAKVLDSAFLMESVGPVFCGWAPGSCVEALLELRERLEGCPVRLVPLES